MAETLEATKELSDVEMAARLAKAKQDFESTRESKKNFPAPELSDFDRDSRLIKAKQEFESAQKAKGNLANRNEFMRGMVRATDQLQGTYSGGVGMVHSLLGNESEAAGSFASYQDEMRQSTENPATVDKFFSSDPKSGAMASAGNMATWAAGTAGSLVPSVAESALSGVAGAAAGSMLVPGPDPTDVATVPIGAIAGMFGKGAVKNAIAKAAEQYVKQGVKKEAAEQMATQAVRNTIAKRVGASVAASQTTAFHEGGGMYMEGREKGYDNPMSALGLGQLSGASEVAFGAFPSGLRMAFAKAGVADVAKSVGTKAAAGYAWDVIKNSTQEGVQEAFQEFLGSVNESINDPKAEILTKENFMKWAESAAAGALGGGMFGAAEVSQSAYLNRGQEPQSSAVENPDTVSQTIPPALPPTQPSIQDTVSQNPTQPPALPTETPIDPVMEGLTPEDIQRLGALDTPPTKLSAHQWAKAVKGDRSKFDKAPDESVRIQQWEKARSAATGVDTGYVQPKAVTDQSEADAIAEEVARRRAAKSGVKPPALPEQQPPALPTPEPNRDTVSQKPPLPEPPEQITAGQAVSEFGSGLVDGLYAKVWNDAQSGSLEKMDKPPLFEQLVLKGHKAGVVKSVEDVKSISEGLTGDFETDKNVGIENLNRLVAKYKAETIQDTVSQPEQPKNKGKKPVEPAAPEATVTTSVPPSKSSVPFLTPEWKSKRETEVAEKVGVSLLDGEKLKSVKAKMVKQQIDEEIDLIEKHPPGTKFKLGNYPEVMTVLDDGTVSAEGRKMGDNVGSLLRDHKGFKLEVLSKPEVSPIGDSTPQAETPSILMPETFDELEALPKYSVYGRKSSDGSKVRYQVRGDGKRGGGDSIHDTIEQAQEEAALVKRRDAERQASQDKAKSDEEAAVKKQADYESSFGGFLSSDAMNKGRQLKVLSANRSYQGKVTTVKDIVEQKVAGGAVVNDRGQLESPDGAFLGSDKITKIGIDYAKHLIETKNRDTVSQNPKPEPENKDASQPKRGGDPNGQVETEKQAEAQAKADGRKELLGDKGGQAAGETPSSDSSSYEWKKGSNGLEAKGLDGYIRLLPAKDQLSMDGPAQDVYWISAPSKNSAEHRPQTETHYSSLDEAKSALVKANELYGKKKPKAKTVAELLNEPNDSSDSSDPIAKLDKLPLVKRPGIKEEPAYIKSLIPRSELEPDMELALQRDVEAAGEGKMSEYLSKRASEQAIYLDKLESGQTIVEAKGVRHFIDNLTSKDLKAPLIIQFGDRMIVRDGNTRVNAAILRGDKEIVARVVFVSAKSKSKKPPAKPLSEWEQGVADLLATVPAFKGASFEMSKDQNTVKVTRPDDRTTTIYFNSDAALDKLAESKGVAFAYGSYNYRTGSKFDGHIYLRSNGDAVTLNHEVVHWLEDEGIITAEEVEKYGGREGLAEAYGVWAANKSRPANTLFEKIYDFLDSIFNVNSKFFKELTDRVEATPFENSPEAIPAYVISGQQRSPKRIAEHIKSGGVFEGRPVGVAVGPTRMSDNAVGLAALHVNAGGTLFVDSGMFGTVTKGDPGQEPKWKDVFDEYDRIADMIDPSKRRNMMAVMPDYLVKLPDGTIVGDTDKTIHLQSEWASKAQDLMDANVRILIPIQMDFTNPDRSISSIFGDTSDAFDLAGGNFGVAIPYNKAAWPEEAVLEFVRVQLSVAKQDGSSGSGFHIHLLGGGKARAEKLWEKIREIDPTVKLTGDAATEARNLTRKNVDAEAVEKMAPGAKKRNDREAKAREDGFNAATEARLFNENFIKIVSDDVEKIRKQDVYRLLSEVPNERAGNFENWLMKRRPDLAEEINTSSNEILEERAKLADIEQVNAQVGDVIEKDGKRGVVTKIKKDGVVQSPTEAPVVDTTAIPEDGMSVEEFANIFANPEQSEASPSKKTGRKPEVKKPGSGKKDRSKGVKEGLDEAKAGADLILKGMKDLGVTGFSGPPINADMAKGLGMLANGLIKAGKYKFAEFIDSAIELLGAPAVRYLSPYLEAGWNKKAETDERLDKAGSAVELLAKDTYGTAEAPNRVALGRYFASRLRDGASYARITDARKEAAGLIGGSPKDGTQAIKTIDEAIEIGVVMVARDIAQDGDSDSSIYDDLVSLYERQPNLGTRTSTSMLNQAYSTPAPLAFLVNRQAGITQEDTVYDSSAGNGMLLIVGGKRIANELNPDRVEALESQGIETTSKDATEFDLNKPITALAINPPFGEIKQDNGSSKQWTVDGVKTDKVDHAITIKSLSEIPDNGKVAIIIGAKGFEQRKSKDDSRRGKAYLNGKAFYDFVYDNYNVTDHYTVNGDLYSRQGASFPVDVIIIEGRGKSSRPKPYNIVGGGIPKVFDSWEELKNAKLLGNIRSTESGTERGTVDTRKEGVPSKAAGDAQQGSDGVRAGARGASQQDGRSVQGPGKSEQLGGHNEDANVPGQTESTVGSNKQSASEAGRGKQQSRADNGGNDSRVSGGAKNRDAGVDKLDSDESEVKGDQYQSVYTPSSKSKSVDALIPNNHQTAVQAALDSVEEQYGDIDEFVAKELGVNQTRLHKVFSAEQVDALALAIARHKDGRAFILGDQTGVGKGRVAAGMLIYAKNQGLAPVFFTEKPTLYADIIRDLIDTGFSTDDAPFNPLITNVTAKKSDQIDLPDGRVLKQTAGADESNITEAVGNFLAGKGLAVTSKKATKKKVAETKTYDAIFTTYNQMVTINGELKPRHTFLKQISPRAFFVLDESHNAGGSAQDSDKEKPQKAEDNKIPVSEMVRDLIESASGVYFSSGTYAKRPSVMDLYAKTGMTAATGQDGDSLASSIAAGGVPLQQIVSQQLVESGAYLRRERSFDGVEFKPQVYDVSTEGAEQSAAIFRAINAFDKIKGQLVEEEIEDGVTSSGGSIKPDWATGEAGMTSTNFSSILWNLTDQMLLAVKADVIADEAIASIERGESPVIYVDATMEAALNAYIESSGLQVGEKSEFSFRDLLQRYLDRSREVLVQGDVADKNSYEQVRLTDEQLGDIGLAAFNKAQELIDDFSAELPASPIDWIRKRIEDEGYTFGEYTGRQMVMRYQNANTATVEKRPEDEVGAANRINLIRKFNNGDLDVLLFNRSGSTGISMHASEKVKNQKPRHMIIGQAASNIDTFMQSLGRIHRTGQVTLPKFTLAMTSLPSEIRPSSVLVKKLASLNANVTASDKGSVSFDVPDVMNVIGDRIVAEYLAENDELNRALNEGEGEGLVTVGRTGQPRIVPGIARKASGRLAIMPIKVQQEFWDSVTDTFADTIEELDRMGANPLSARVADLDAKTVESFPVFEGDIESANVFDRPAYIEKVIAKRPGKPMTPDEIMQKVTSFYKLEPDSKDLQATMNTWEMNRREEALASTAKRIEEIRNEGLEKGTDPERIKNSIDRENQQKQNFLYLVRAFTPGTSVSVWESGPSDGLDVIPGVVLSIERKGKGGNPISLSKWRVEIAIGSPDRIIRMSLSQLRVASDQNDKSTNTDQDENSEDNLKVFTNREMVNDSVLKDFVESEVSTMETRYIGTGNILAAFNLFREQKGRVTFFRDSDGNLQRGVLLPRRFKIDKWINDQPVGFERVDQIQRFLASGNNLQTPDRALSVMSVRGGLVLRAPKSKARGGKYTLSKVLLDASSPQEFVSIGSRMEMVIDEPSKQKDVINAILSISGLQATTDKDLARSIKSDGVQKKNSDLAKKITKLPDTLYQTDDVNPSIRLQALDIAFAAEDAGISSFDQLVAYSVKTVGERRTREAGAYLELLANQMEFKGVRSVGDILGSPNVTKEQAASFAKAAFPMLSDEQIEAGVAIVERIGLLDKVGFAPFGSQAPDQGQSQKQGGTVKGWTSFISATRALIGATNKADISTFIHEIAHPMRRFLLNRGVPQSKRADITDTELDALDKAVGAENGVWEVENEEKFAKMWERYWFEGKPPKNASPELQSLFEKIAQWMSNVYKAIQQITGRQLPQEVRDLFDKLVRNGDEEIQDTVSQNENRDTMSQNEPDVTSIKNALVDERRLLRGIPALADVASQTQEEWLEAADALLQDDPMLGDRLVKELNANARNLSNVEVAVMQIYYRGMNNRLEKVSNRLFAAKDANNAVESARALLDVDMVMNSLAEIEEATKAAGREWGRAGVARQIELEKDFSRAAVLRKARIANGGNALSAKQLEDMNELARKVADLEGKLAKAVQEKLDLERKKNVESQIEDSKSKVRSVPGSIGKKAVDRFNAFKNKFASAFASSKKTDSLFATEDEQMVEEAKSVIQVYTDMGVFSLGEFLANIRKELGSDLPVAVEAAFTTAWNEMRANGDVVAPMVDKNDVRGLSRLAKQIERSLVEAGITKLEDVVRGVRESLQEIIPDITERETMDAMSGYGQYSAPSDDPNDKIIADINGRLLELAKLNDMENKIAPARTGVGRQEKSPEHRELIRKVNLAKREGKYRVTDPDTQLKSAVGSALTALSNRIHDLNKSIYVTKQPIVSATKEDRAGQDAEVIKLRKERDELAAIYKTMFPKPGATMDQRIAATDRALERVLADLVKQLQTENFTTAKKSDPISTKELDAKRARIDALRAEREAIVGVRKQTEEQKSKAYKAILLKQIADYQDRTRNSYFAPNPKRETRTLSPEEVALKLELKNVKDDFFRFAGLYRLQNMSPRERAWDYVRETAHLSRALMTSFDFSAVFRQGGIIAFAHPKMAQETSMEMYRAMASEAATLATAEKIRKDDMYQFAMTAGLSITEDDAKITKQEEAYMGRWARLGIGAQGTKLAVYSKAALFPVSASARGYMTFLNGLRFKLFKQMVANLGKGGQVTADEAKTIAMYINAATGRSELGPMMKWAEQANMLFFAPRFVASRFQYLGMPLWLLGSKKVSGRVKKAIAMEYIRHSAGIGTFLAVTVALGSLLAGDDEDEKPTVSLDPRSSDFLKIKLGETRIDPMSGLSQVITLMGRIASGQRVGVDGKIVDLRGENVPYGGLGMAGTVGNFVRTKFAPIPGAAFDIASGENVVGQPVTPYSSIVNLFIPLSLREIKETAESRGIPQGALISLISLHGMGASTYGPESNYRKATSEEREKQFKKDIKKMTFDSKEPAYKGFLSEDQKSEVDERREDRKQGLVFAASAHPVRKEYKSEESYNTAVADRDISLEKLKKSGLSLDEARKLLIKHWESQYGSAKEIRKGVRVYKEALSNRLRHLRKVFSE